MAQLRAKAWPHGRLRTASAEYPYRLEGEGRVCPCSRTAAPKADCDLGADADESASSPPPGPDASAAATMTPPPQLALPPSQLLLLPLLVLLAVPLLPGASAAAAATTRPMLQQETEQQPTAPPLPPPSSPSLPPPPPPFFIGTASTSLEVFRLLYSGNITKIRIANDITLLAADADAAIAGLDGAAIGGGIDINAETAAALGLGGRLSPVLRSNLTIVGSSRGMHTRLDMNFLSSLLRLSPGITLTLRNLEVYKALNHIGQSLDFVAKSGGGAVALVNCVQRRAACMPFFLAVAQLLSLPPAAQEQAQVPPDISLRNDSSFCWSTSTLMPVCRRPSIVVSSLAVEVAPMDGVLADGGGYDVSYKDSHIVCEHLIDPECPKTSSPERCFAQELVWRFGDALPPPLEAGAAAAAPPSGDEGGNSGPSPLVLGLAIGFGGGGTVLTLLSLLACALVAVHRHRRAKAAAAAAAGVPLAATIGSGKGDGGGGGDDARSMSPLANMDVGGAPGRHGTARAEHDGTAVVRQGKDLADHRATASGCGTTSSGGGGGGDGDGSREASSETRGVGSSSSRAVSKGTAAAAAASVASDPMDVEAIRRSLLSGRKTEAPLNVQMMQMIGEGSFGKVYKGIWHGTVVALKVLVLSGNLTQDQRRRQMAVMEAAISSAMSHPNIVQTYTYSFRPIREVAGGAESHVAAAGSGSTTRGSGADVSELEINPADGPLAAQQEASSSSRVYGHELLLVLEYCDRGSFRQALDAGVFHRRGAAAAPSDPLKPAAEFSTLTCPVGPPAAAHGVPYGGGAADGASRRSQEGYDASPWQMRSDDQAAYNYGLMLQVACDVASALLHLHSHGVVHGDIKVSNVLLKTAAPDGRRMVPSEPAAEGPGGSSRSGSAGSPPPLSSPPSTSAPAFLRSPFPSMGLIAKVADFGLSTVMGFEGDLERTHISALTAQGSLTHMAPELMLHGHVSKRVDVYAFGVMLFELLTGRAHRGVPRALLPHQVAVCGLRPSLPPYTPRDYRRLAEACWQADPTKRPTFQAILIDLNRMRQAHAAAAAAVGGSLGTSFSTAASPASAAAAAVHNTRADGWVALPSLESSTCDSALFAELAGTSAFGVEAAGAAGGGASAVRDMPSLVREPGIGGGGDGEGDAGFKEETGRGSQGDEGT